MTVPPICLLEACGSGSCPYLPCIHATTQFKLILGRDISRFGSAYIPGTSLRTILYFEHPRRPLTSSRCCFKRGTVGKRKYRANMSEGIGIAK